MKVSKKILILTPIGILLFKKTWINFDKFSIQKILEIGSFPRDKALVIFQKITKGQIHCLDTWKGDDDLRRKILTLKL